MTQAKIVKMIIDTVLIGSGSVLMIVGLIGLVLPILPGTSFVCAGLSCYERSIPFMRKKAYSKRILSSLKRSYTYLTTF